MRAFKDKNGIEWEIDLTIGLVEYVKDKMDIDLLEPVGEGEESLAVNLSMINIVNIRKFTELLFVLCEDQCKEREIEKPAFLKALSSECFKSAYTAFFDEWQSFFQSLGRMDLADAIAKIVDFLSQGINEVRVEIQKIEYPTGKLSTSTPE